MSSANYFFSGPNPNKKPSNRESTEEEDDDDTDAYSDDDVIEYHVDYNPNLQQPIETFDPKMFPIDSPQNPFGTDQDSDSRNDQL